MRLHIVQTKDEEKDILNECYQNETENIPSFLLFWHPKRVTSVMVLNLQKLPFSCVFLVASEYSNLTGPPEEIGLHVDKPTKLKNLFSQYITVIFALILAMSILTFPSEIKHLFVVPPIHRYLIIHVLCLFVCLFFVLVLFCCCSFVLFSYTCTLYCNSVLE